MTVCVCHQEKDTFFYLFLCSNIYFAVVKIPKLFEKGDQSYKPKIACNKTDHLLWATLVQPVLTDRLCGKANLCLLKLLDAKCTKNNQVSIQPD